MALTDTAIRKAKPKDKPYKVSDSGGLYLLVNPVGSKLWRVKYRLHGAERKLSLGAYPAISLAEPRQPGFVEGDPKNSLWQRSVEAPPPAPPKPDAPTTPSMPDAKSPPTPPAGIPFYRLRTGHCRAQGYRAYLRR